MSWGTYYKFNGYLSHISKHELDIKVEECDETIRQIFSEIIAYMAMTPPLYAKDCEGEEYPWVEHIANQARQYQEELEEAIALRARLQDCLETLLEHPEDVSEG
ncbi:MAG: hypothetical protein J6X55_11305 [Victivallales bacterium]|nr:hypothetical protein [Victivallales bacterium]